MNSAREVTIQVDNQTVTVDKGLTILQAAERNGIYIPTLCTHKDLSPFGGCRMCIVEVEKMRGLPTACTTPVEEGMVIRTNTAQVQAVRADILQLILSEHTSSCLICDEKEECKLYSTTIRKAGVTTGCRYCPNDNRCELQDVVAKLGLQEIGHPIYYRNLPVEKEDPFFDRDYNLCILCGRCVRMCQDIRTAGTLAFTQRGRQTVIGPAFNRTHMEAGCEFCGACVSVCPTGALAEKTNKWEGKHEREEITTCPFCGVGCQVRLLVKGDKILGSLPAEDPLINHGQLCVKGRFCVPEIVNGPQRLVRPYKVQAGAKAFIDWAEAIDLAAARLSACAPEDFGMLISPNCCNEDLYIAQKFARTAMASHRIDTSARIYYGSGFHAYLRLFKRSVPLSALEQSQVILCLGLDARFGRSVVGVELRKAIKRGAKVVTIHPREHSFSVISHEWIQPVPGEEQELLRSLARLTAEGMDAAGSGRDHGGDLNARLEATAKLLRGAEKPVFLLGSEFLHCDAAAGILEAIDQLARNTGAGVMLLPAQNNLLGSILMGAYPEFLPGGVSSLENGRLGDVGQRWGLTLPRYDPSWNVLSLSPDAKLKVLYLVGEALPQPATLAEFTIYQNIGPTESVHDANLILPAAAFSEIEGTVINGEGRMQRVKRGVLPPGQALPDWQIICRIAKKMGVAGFDFECVEEVQQEIASVAAELADFDADSRRSHPVLLDGGLAMVSAGPIPVQNNGASPYLPGVIIAEHSHRGFPLSTWVEGAKALFAERKRDVQGH